MTREPLSRIVLAYDRDVSSVAEQFPDITFDVAETPEDLERLIPHADALLGGWGLRPELLDKATRLKWIQTGGAGVEGLANEDFARRGIILTNGRGVMSSNMAEQVIGLMLTFARQLHVHWESQRLRTWRSDEARSKLFELAGQTAILVGTGMIGKDLSRRLKGLDMRVIGVRRSTGGDSIPGFDEIVPLRDLDVILPQGDHVVSSVPHTAETLGMWNADRFRHFRDGAFFYNVGRGTSVVQPDLIAVLESGRLGGAGLDVATPEPLPADDPLWDAPNLLITHHSAGATPKFAGRVVALFAENIRRYQDGEQLANLVDISRGY
jgi:D-2-hydroxyacid dehydrogenase (NADP+)